MNDWKNPNNFPSGLSNEKKWKAPQVNEKDEDISNAIQGIALIFRGVLGFVVMCSVNATAVFAVTQLLGMEVKYINCVMIACVYVLWSTYDTLVFRKLRNGK
jgi:hypothetical protein